MLSNLYRCLTRVTEKVHDPKRPHALVLSRRTFTRALALVAFGGVARPASPRVLPSTICECDSNGQCTGGCEPNYRARCRMFGRRGIAANCWCQAMGGDVYWHVCDCRCPGTTYEFCTCRRTDYAPCNLA